MRNSSKDKLRLSPSALNVFLDCQRCFWLEYGAGVHRPRGPFPSLPSGMDILIKKYFDSYRAVGKLPPEIERQVSGYLFSDTELLNKWRSWRSGLSYYDRDLGAVLVGAIDDCLVENERYIPIDYKTRGFDLADGGESFYQNQMNCYSFLLDTNGMKQPSYAYLAYFIPREIKKGADVRFSVHVKKLNTFPEDALNTFRKAVKLLRSPIPSHDDSCQFCTWNSKGVNNQGVKTKS